ncbi:LPXTG-motif cell wall-anchored protein [Streptomyces sp. V4I23]|uniref:LAETG motif-containing sortase-dependent surface protein n=1 Tax=Streptomyces sp. V4I23 TaxID=3042282 RepID=UPI00278811AE|nr:LAETG motif-containing sortase-dependent surface protein [Streptomyces sp. V4I23]MDQ1009763.1 LPXTG-motif cell wall-anchored protein [Streptomyces sp. V4I23]
MLATAVVTAVTTPAVLLTVTPAFADARPTAGQSAAAQAAEDKPTIEELEAAAAEAQKAYDAAVAAEKAAKEAFDFACSDEAPHAVAAKAAADEAAAAKTAKEAADQALADAETELAELPETATEEERAAAEKKVADAKAAADAAEATKAAADEKAKKAATDADNARVAAGQALTKAEKATAEALKAKEAADKALADAKAEEDEDEDEDDDNDGDDGGACVPENGLTTVAQGLPSKIVAGSTVDFSVRVTNGTDKTLDEVLPFVYFHATDKSGYNVIDEYFGLQWSTKNSPEWNDVADGEYAGSISPLKAGAHADVKLRLKVDAKAPAGEGMAFVAGDYVNDDGTCGGNFFTEYEFDLLAAGSKPGKVDDAKPGKTSKTRPAVVPQGGTTGTLANTGADSALPQLAAAAGAAIALGAGAVFVVRRRKASSGS